METNKNINPTFQNKIGLFYAENVQRFKASGLPVKEELGVSGSTIFWQFTFSDLGLEKSKLANWYKKAIPHQLNDSVVRITLDEREVIVELNGNSAAYNVNEFKKQRFEDLINFVQRFIEGIFKSKNYASAA